MSPKELAVLKVLVDMGFKTFSELTESEEKQFQYVTDEDERFLTNVEKLYADEIPLSENVLHILNQTKQSLDKATEEPIDTLRILAAIWILKQTLEHNKSTGNVFLSKMYGVDADTYRELNKLIHSLDKNKSSYVALHTKYLRDHFKDNRKELNNLISTLYTFFEKQKVNTSK